MIATPASGATPGVHVPGPYARVERERRFLLAHPPDAPDVVATRRITDLYLADTRLRLRRTRDEDAASFRRPSTCVAEVTDDLRFTGGSLVGAAREELLSWPAEYGLEGTVRPACPTDRNSRSNSGPPAHP
jgi:hypothetical protein